MNDFLRLGEDIQPAETPREMRAAIFRLAHYDSMTRNVLNMADYEGMSAEDKYTILAYNALKVKQELIKNTS